MYRHVRFRIPYDRMDRIARRVNDRLQDAGFPPVIVEGHRLHVPEYPEVIQLLLAYLPNLKDRLCR